MAMIITMSVMPIANNNDDKNGIDDNGYKNMDSQRYQ